MELLQNTFFLNHEEWKKYVSHCLYRYIYDPKGLSPIESAQWLIFWSSRYIQIIRELSEELLSMYQYNL